MAADIHRKRALHLRLGKRGENLAVRYFERNGFEVILRNYRNKYGEVDIIARDGLTLCFIEVKTRRYTTRSKPSEGLGSAQKRRITRAAEAYLSELRNPQVTYRFDLIELIIGRWDIISLFYWKNHFGKNEKDIGRIV